MNWVGRNGAMIPLNMQVDRADCANGCVVTSGTFANAQFFLEYRPFIEDTDFWGVNPGFDWQLTDDAEARCAGQLDEEQLPPRIADGAGDHAGELGRHGNYTNDGGIPTITHQRRPQQSGQLRLGRRPREHPGRAARDRDQGRARQPDLGRLEGAEPPRRRRL